MPKLAFDLEIYSYQIDFARHVSNIVYIQWMEIGRLQLLKAMDMPIDKQGFHPILVETQISYKKPFFLGESVRGHVWVTELAKVSVWLDFAFTDEQGETRATGRQRGLFVDSATSRPKRLTPQQMAVFDTFRDG
jgi:acyl-CoA thioester hydrolase